MSALNTLVGILQVRFAEFRTRQEGQGLVEYALILALIAVVAIVALQLIGTETDATLDEVGNALT